MADDKKPNPWGEFVTKSTRMRFMPHDAYSHATNLLAADSKEKKETFPDLIDPHSLLGNISSDELMYFYQEDAAILVQLFRLSQKAKEIGIVFETLYTGWVYSIALTRARSGLERLLQSLLSQFPTQLQGFGKSFELQEQARQAQQDSLKNAIVS